MPELTSEQTTIALAVAAGVALLSFLIALVALLRLRRVRREYSILLGPSGDRDLLGTVSSAVQRIDAMDHRVDQVVDSHQELLARQRFALQKFHMVRYDAFDDMGGRLSFSAALLDDHGDGVVLTSINGRTETRTYAKPVRNLTSDHNLSGEEREAIAGAVAGYERGNVPAEATR